MNLAQIVGTLATIQFIALYIPGLPVAGTDGWALTKEIGKRLGDATEDAINTISGVVGDAGGMIVDAAEDAYEFVEDVWNAVTAVF